MIRNFLFVFYLFFASLFILELCFQFLPVSDSLRVQPVNSQNPIMHLEPNRTVHRQLGYKLNYGRDKRVNNFGFMSDEDFHTNKGDKRGIAVIGDSYVEALNVENKDTVGGLLQIFLKDYPVLPIGRSGTPISQYLAYAKWAKVNFNPQVYIFIIIPNDFTQPTNSKGVHVYDSSFKLVRTDYEPSALKKILRRSAFLRYLQLDLQVLNRLSGLYYILSEDKSENKQENSEKSEKEKRRIQKLLNIFMPDLKKALGDAKILFVLDADRKSIYSDGLEKDWPSSVKFGYEHLKLICCSDSNIDFIDMNKAFKELYLKNFLMFNPKIDPHWNEYGHGVVFNEIKKSEFVKELTNQVMQ